ncbi:OprD family outer membrane porin [Shewanella inventionis]|nr:OprD family outer membrane porin [Shewanella inventionis]MCL1159744.1 OprD family porin [Shewanella inventionis]
MSNNAFSNGDIESFSEWIHNGNVGGTAKSYYFEQDFDDSNAENSSIWVNGGNVTFNTSEFNGFKLGGEVQGSYVSNINDDDDRTAGSINAQGLVLSEAFLRYQFGDTVFSGGRQHFSSPLIANSGSRLIKESFEMYQVSSSHFEDTDISIGYVTKYQTRTDKSFYVDNEFVDFDYNGSGSPGDFYKIGNDGVFFAQVNKRIAKKVKINSQYANVINEVQALYADVEYTLPTNFKSYIAMQYYKTKWDKNELVDNDLLGFKVGFSQGGVDFFAGYTLAGGNEGENRVFRGIGQGAYYQFTATTKTAGVAAFEAGTNSYQLGVGTTLSNVKGKLFYTSFDNPIVGKDLNEWTVNLAYQFDGKLANCGISVDFSILDYESNQKDATDLRTKFSYSF